MLKADSLYSPLAEESISPDIVAPGTKVRL